MARGRVFVQKQEDIGEFPEFLQLGCEEGRGALSWLPLPPRFSCLHCLGWLGTQPHLVLLLGADPWPWKELVEWDIDHTKDAFGQQVCEHLLRLSCKAYIFWLSCRAPITTSVLVNTVGQGLFSLANGLYSLYN